MRTMAASALTAPPTSVRVTSAGQVSLPAIIRRRWAAEEVLVIDRGSYCIVRPVPSSVGALRGALGAPGQVPSEELRRRAREAEGQGRQS